MSRNTIVSTLFKFSFYLVCGAALCKEVCKEEGDTEYGEGEYNYAIVCYTEGIDENCRNKDCDAGEKVNAKLFTNRAAAHLQLVRTVLCFLLAEL